MTGATEAEKYRTRLYLISPPRIETSFKDDVLKALDGGDVACFQLRLKDLPRDDIMRACELLMPSVQDRGVAFIVNDDPQIAREVGADGVHVGQDDTPYKEARAIVGDDAIVGVTCHNSRHLAMVAAENGADYVAFGAFYPTSTKDAKTSAEPELLQWWSSLAETPVVAIGGITVDNAALLVKSGADFLAVSAGVWKYEGGPVLAVKELNKVIDMTMAS
ncbi:thiamine phosphate synthase [Sneathiella glossodoripedis]|uniref:thiamine phosphate synthase n=1 Tax=Sneathiella glossodoripedis TaxID=418853 RepID=UPI000471E2DB|nr:thiamine phosphate synthase [Sneathiella glossodoripedis]